MTITPHFILICEQAFLTAGTNNLNCIGIFTTIHAEKFPLTYQHFALVANFSTDTLGNHTLATRATDENGTELFSSKLDVQINTDPFQVIANFENLTFPKPGTFTFTVSLDGKDIGSRIIIVQPVVRQRETVA